MQAETLIHQILESKKIEDIIYIGNFKTEFNDVLKLIHPDKCQLDKAAEATTKMNEWKYLYENGKEFIDDVGPFKTNYYWADYKSDVKNLNWSVENYRLFKQQTSDADKHFLKYLPQDCILQPDGTYRFIFEKRSIPLSELELPQVHVNWILNRIFEYCAYLSQIGFCHCGINPDSIFIVPETHGIQVMSFYHLTRTGNKIGTVSGKYKNWYPTETFTDKVGVSSIDIELAKRTAAYLLGDKSGSGVRFRKTHNEKFIDFLLTRHNNAYQCLSTYRKLLEDNFKKEFHLLTI